MRIEAILMYKWCVLVCVCVCVCISYVTVRDYVSPITPRRGRRLLFELHLQEIEVQILEGQKFLQQIPLLTELISTDNRRM